VVRTGVGGLGLGQALDEELRLGRQGERLCKRVACVPGASDGQQSTAVVIIALQNVYNLLIILFIYLSI
jgi:hypothetical protein